MGYYSLESIAEELGVPPEDVEVVAQIEVMNEEWDDDWERVDARGRAVILEHFNGGRDSEHCSP